MFDTLEKEIDGVVISTPDHTHFHPAWWALERGKHVYLEKPLAHEVEEVRRLTEAARAKKLATQLGCQRHAFPGLRAGVDLVKAGTIGTVTEVHSWIKSKRGLPKPLGASERPPATLDWDLWIGPVAARPYTAGLAPYDWRFWWDFGTGETGNWGCHPCSPNGASTPRPPPRTRFSSVRKGCCSADSTPGYFCRRKSSPT
jgi:predicted dehydrogenase